MNMPTPVGNERDVGAVQLHGLVVVLYCRVKLLLLVCLVARLLGLDGLCPLPLGLPSLLLLLGGGRGGRRLRLGLAGLLTTPLGVVLVVVVAPASCLGGIVLGPAELEAKGKLHHLNRRWCGSRVWEAGGWVGGGDEDGGWERGQEGGRKERSIVLRADGSLLP